MFVSPWGVRIPLGAAAAWSVFGLTCVLVAMGGKLGMSAGAVQVQPSDAALGLAFTAVGALIATRRRGNRLGWLALLMGALAGVDYAADAYARWAAGNGAPDGAWAAWVGLWAWAPAWLALGTVLLLLIPDGRLPSDRWRPVLVAAWTAIALWTVVGALTPPQDAGSPANPLAIPALASALRPLLGVVLVLLLVVAVGCLAGLVARLRRSTGMVRLQLA